MEFGIGIPLIAGAVAIIMFLSVYIGKATNQYFRDTDRFLGMIKVDERLKELMAEAEDDQLSAIRNQIEPTPVLFTDRFRWFLVRDPTSTRLESQRSSLSNGTTMHHQPSSLTEAEQPKNLKTKESLLSLQTDRENVEAPLDQVASPEDDRFEDAVDEA